MRVLLTLCSHLLLHQPIIPSFLEMRLLVSLQIITPREEPTTILERAAEWFFMCVATFVSFDVFQALESLVAVRADMSFIQTRYDEWQYVP